jgi:hypothetical protein
MESRPSGPRADTSPTANAFPITVAFIDCKRYRLRPRDAEEPRHRARVRRSLTGRPSNVSQTMSANYVPDQSLDRW